MGQAQKLGQAERKAKVKKDEWGTPAKLHKFCIDAGYHFTLDAAATSKNALCKKFYTKKDDALKKNWYKGAKGGDCWLNHPYSMNEKFIRKCAKEAKRGLNILNLGPADTSCKYFALYLQYCTCTYLISGRVKFKGAESAATFSSGLYVFGKDKLAAKYNPNGEKIVLLELSPRVRGGKRR
jgi:phage N-6-adenine-methyltransferase